MKTRILTLALIGATLIFTACTDKKKKDNSKTTKTEKVEKSEDHGHPHGPNGEHVLSDAEKKRLDSIRKVNGGFLKGPNGELIIPEGVSEAERRRLDSIRQVKEHGHAH